MTETATPVEQVADLNTIARGAANEQFREKFDEVLQNIRDPNAPAKAKRKIILEMVFAPDESREKVITFITARAVLAPNKPSGDVLFVGRHEGKTVATVYHRPGEDPRQGIIEFPKKKAGDQ